MENTIKTAVSLPKALFERAEDLASKMRVSRSKLMALALQEYVSRAENQRLLQRINEAVREAMDEDDEQFLQASAVQMARIAEAEADNRW
jgi:metal-responsive CopG/Arc/MetJ family transcriptional regulator